MEISLFARYFNTSTQPPSCDNIKTDFDRDYQVNWYK
jgi:hypothetical protein